MVATRAIWIGLSLSGWENHGKGFNTEGTENTEKWGEIRRELGEREKIVAE